MDYEQLDTTTQLNLIRARIRDVEQQYFSLDLRVNTPDLTQPVSEQDQANLTMLSNSIAALKQREQALVSANPAPASAEGTH